MTLEAIEEMPADQLTAGVEWRSDAAVVAESQPANDTAPDVAPPQRIWTYAKRVVDIVGGTVLFALACPIILTLAVVVAIQFRAWPFFVHERIGFRGRPIRIPKLRTLSPRTPAYADKRSLKPSDVSPFTRFLRHSHLDELPQLLLVPIGRMSLVGPRPKMPDWVEPVDPEFGFLRTTVRPGCTGLWQIGVDTDRPVAASPAYDRVYIQYGSVRLDLWILCRTVLTMTGIARRVGPMDFPAWTRRGFARSAARATASVLADDGPEVAPELS